MDFAYLSSETTSVRIDLDYAPLDDVRVRKALNLAIDWEGLKTLFGEESLRASQMVVPGINGHNGAVEAWTYDPAQATALLEEARADGVAVDTEINLVTACAIFILNTAIDLAYALLDPRIRRQTT